MADTSTKLVSVHTLANRFEADVLMEALRREGIPALLRGFEETPYSGIFVPQKGWGRIMVPKQLETQAREIVQALVEDVRRTDAPYVDASEIDPVLWERLRSADSATVVKNAAVKYDDEDKVYIVPFFKTAVICWPEDERMDIIGEYSKFSRDFQLHLVVLHYLLEAQDRPLSKKWVNGKDLPSANVFFQGPHALPVAPLVKIFDPNPELLAECAEKMGGEKSDMGGVSYEFPVLPEIPLLLIFWPGDEEFKSSMHMLFDPTITQHLPLLDQVFAFADVFSRIMVHTATPAREGEADE